MNMKKKSQLLAMLGMALAMSPPDQMNDLLNFEETPTLVIPPTEKPPSGAKEYFFNQLGEFSTERMLKVECVFKCFAINDKNAKRKFGKWRKLNYEKNI